MEGYTLAVDFRASDKAERVLSALEDMTVSVGGRLYFAKDAVMQPGHVAAMYPELGAWRAAVSDADPDRAYETDLTRRLKLRDAS